MKPFTLIFVLVFAVNLAAEDMPPLKLVQTIPLEAVEGRIDHLALDGTAKRLYVAALGNDTVEVIDLAAGMRVETVSGPKEPQGLAVLSESHALAVASGGDGMFRLYGESLKLSASLGELDDADNVRLDASGRHAYVGYGGGALAEIDPATATKLREIKLDGHPESFQLEKRGTRIFVNVPASRHVAAIDRAEWKIVARWSLGDAQSNFPMALDEEHQRLFVGCRQPAKLVVLDTASGEIVASLDCCGDTDDVWYDAQRKRLYVSGGQGCITVVQVADADRYTVVATLPTAPGARTSYFDSASGSLYVAVPKRGQQPAEIRVYNTHE